MWKSTECICEEESIKTSARSEREASTVSCISSRRFSVTTSPDESGPLVKSSALVTVKMHQWSCPWAWRRQDGWKRVIQMNRRRRVTRLEVLSRTVFQFEHVSTAVTNSVQFVKIFHDIVTALRTFRLQWSHRVRSVGDSEKSMIGVLQIEWQEKKNKDDQHFEDCDVH